MRVITSSVFVDRVLCSSLGDNCHYSDEMPSSLPALRNSEQFCPAEMQSSRCKLGYEPVSHTDTLLILQAKLRDKLSEAENGRCSVFGGMIDELNIRKTTDVKS